MKKTILTLSLIFFIAAVAAQQFFPFHKPIDLHSVNPIKNKISNNKAFGDTLWYEDFDGSLPIGWNIVNNNSSINNYAWMWDTVAKNGVASVGVPFIQSTTAANGFMSLPSDYYNTPRPSTGSVEMDTYFESNTISIVPQLNVLVSYQQHLIYCCRDAVLTGAAYDVNIFLQVSTDNFTTFTTYLANDGIPSNFYRDNGAVNVIDISNAVSNVADFKIRFYAKGLTNYIWYIDDIAILEGGGQKITDYGMHVVGRDHFTTMPIMPINYAQDYGFYATAKSASGDTIKGLNLNVSMAHVSYLNGAAGQGGFYSHNRTGSNLGTLAPYAKDTFKIDFPSFTPNWLGNYKVDFSINSTTFFTPDFSDYKISITDTVFGKDFDTSYGAIGPQSYLRNGIPGGTVSGDFLGTTYFLDTISSGIEFSSVSFYVSGDMRNVGSVIRPVVWEYDPITAVNVFRREVASTLTNYTITASQLNSWQTFKLDTGIALNRTNNFGFFIVGWEQVSVAGGTSFSVGHDYSARPFTEDLRSFIRLGHAQSQGGGIINELPMIRLNVKQIIPVGLSMQNDKEVGLIIYPNPSEGFFKIEGKEGISELQLYDNRGRMIFQKRNLTPVQRERINLENEEKGLYFIKVVDSKGRIAFKKLIVK